MAQGKKRKCLKDDLGDGQSSELISSLPKKMKVSYDENKRELMLGLKVTECGGVPSCSQDGEENAAPINDLPVELLEYIFTFLDIKQRIRTELVCKRWRWVGQSVTWTWPRNLIFKARSELRGPSTELASDRVVSSLLDRCGLSVSKLTLQQKMLASWHSKKTVEIVGKCCPNLRELTLLNVPLDTKCLEILAQGCDKLVNLRIVKYGDMYEENLLTILKGCQTLQCICVSMGCNYVSGACFSELSKNMKILSLQRCSQLHPAALEGLTARCNWIQELRLTDCSKIDQETLSKTLYHYKDILKSLYLDRWVEEVNWSKVILVLHLLEELSLCACYNVDDELCRGLANNCEMLRVLYIRSANVSDVGLSNLAPLPNLIELDISVLTISGVGITILATQGRLEKVYAAGIMVLENADECFGDLAQFCPNLKVVDVSYIKGVSDALVEAFCNGLNVGTLKGPIKLGAKHTSITLSAEVCNGLELLLDDVTSLYIDENDFGYWDVDYEVLQTEEFVNGYAVYGY